jgi:excisionase family DNA binding protein
VSAPDLGAAILASLDEETIRALAERLRPYLHGSEVGRLLTPAETAERLSLHPKTVVRMARDGRLPAVKIGTGWRFHADCLDIAPPRDATASAVTSRRPRSRREPASVLAIRGCRLDGERRVA